MLDHDFYSRLRKIKFFAYLEAISSLCVIIFPIFALGIWKYARLGGIFCIAISVSSLAALLYCIRLERTATAHNESFIIPVKASSFEDVVHFLNGERLGADSFASFLGFGGVSIRLLIQKAHPFSPAEVAHQLQASSKCINLRYQISPKVTSFEAASSLRIDLLVCAYNTADLSRWITQDAGKLLSRAESIVRAAIIPDEKVLLVPECPFGASVSEVRRYLAGINLLVQQLGR